MSQQDKYRVMVIVWKWEELRKEGLALKGIEVKGEPFTKIIMVNENQDSKQLKDVLSQNFEQIQNAYKNVDFLYFFHSATITDKNIDTSVKLLESILLLENDFKKHAFSGGKSFIYYNPISDTGLLDQEGAFDHSLHHWKDPLTGKIMRTRTSVSECSEDKEDCKIKQKYFDQVWDFYHGSNVKRKIYNLYENTSLYLLGRHYDYVNLNNTFTEILKRENHWLLNEINDLSNDKEDFEQQIKDVCNKNGNTSYVVDSYKKLIELLVATPLDKSYASKVRGRFADLLSNIPGKIYE